MTKDSSTEQRKTAMASKMASAVDSLGVAVYLLCAGVGGRLNCNVTMFDFYSLVGLLLFMLEKSVSICVHVLLSHSSAIMSKFSCQCDSSN